MYTVKRLRENYGDLLIDTLFLPPLWTEYTLYQVGGCLKGDFWSHHELTWPTLKLVWDLWDRDSIIKANQSLVSHFEKNGVPLFVQVQDDNGFTMREINGFYSGVNLAMQKVLGIAI